ncbi:hypothetical protein BDW74DRAFT_160254 [Aspergillus multicolor]|uniref:uncharacterized protein n=1 Tax=Aspergillus multicolor TaxID=41759 RepID=UPI003CCD6158
MLTLALKSRFYPHLTYFWLIFAHLPVGRVCKHAWDGIWSRSKSFLGRALERHLERCLLVYYIKPADRQKYRLDVEGGPG